MGLFERLFGQRKTFQQSTPEDLSKNPNYIKVYDKFGREMYILKNEWREKILPKSLKDNWDKPNELYNTIFMALEDGFVADLLPSARRLMEIDPDKGRSTCVLGIVFLKNNQLKEAEEIFDNYIKKYGPAGYILTNLAKVYAAKGEEEKSQATLLEALRLDPNQDNALMWFAALQNEKGGKSAYIQTLQQISKFEGSWRAQLWLARDYLDNNDLDSAMILYEQIIERSNNAHDTMMMISGDLGRHGHIAEIVKLFGNYYDPQKHGFATGLNLLEAYYELKSREKGEELLDKMFKLDYLPIRERLKEFADKFKEIDNLAQYGKKANIEGVVTNLIEKPLWYYMLGSPKWFIEDKPRDSLHILFLALANTSSQNITETFVHKEDDPGRLSRTIPLYLSEYFYLSSSMAASAGIMLAEENYGYVVFGKESEIEFSLNLAKKTTPIPDYLVTGFLRQEQNNLCVNLKFIDVHNGTILKTFEVTGKISEIWEIVENIRIQLEALLSKINTQPRNPPKFYRIPKENEFGLYLSSLGSLLGFILSGNNRFPVEGLYGERNTLDFFLNQAVSHKDMQIPKIIFLSGLCSNRVYGSSIYKEYEKKAFELLKDENDKNSPFNRLSPLLYKLYESKDLDDVMHILQKDASPLYEKWLKENKLLEN